MAFMIFSIYFLMLFNRKRRKVSSILLSKNLSAGENLISLLFFSDDRAFFAWEVLALPLSFSAIRGLLLRYVPVLPRGIAAYRALPFFLLKGLLRVPWAFLLIPAQTAGFLSIYSSRHRVLLQQKQALPETLAVTGVLILHPDQHSLSLLRIAPASPANNPLSPQKEEIP